MMPATEDYDAELEPDLVECHVCGIEWDANEVDRPCDCCYECEEEYCTCADDYDDDGNDEPEQPERYVRPLERRRVPLLPDGVEALVSFTKRYQPQLFGVELEMSDLDRSHVRRINTLWNELPIRDVRSRGKFMRVVEDGSIRGDNKGECISIPVSFMDHYRLMLACTMSFEDMRTFDWAALDFKSQKYLFKLLESMVVPRHADAARDPDNCGALDAFSTMIPDAHAWYNESCGMHITTSQMAASPLTWVKLCYFLNNCDHEDYHSLGGRYSSTYLEQRPLGMRHLAHAFRGDARGFTTKYSPLNFKFSQGLMEFRLFRSSVSPLRILSNMQMTQVWLAYFSQCPMRIAPQVTARHIGAYIAQHKHAYPFAAWAINNASDDNVSAGFHNPIMSPIPFTP